VKEIARIGGAQAIGAFAYGTPSIPRVDKICGPGNRYVTAAKRIVSNDCAIDMPAGPTEVLILATGGEPNFIAADLLAQAEHDPDAVALLVTTSARLAREVPRKSPCSFGSCRGPTLPGNRFALRALFSLRRHWMPRFDLLIEWPRNI